MENNTGKTRVLADQHIEHYDGLNRDEIEVGSGEYTYLPLLMLPQPTLSQLHMDYSVSQLIQLSPIYPHVP